MVVARRRAGRHFAPDVAVVGAGPVGCVAALALVREGNRVLAIEAEPEAGRRLAGEWLHPAAVAVLKRTAAAALRPACAGRGFVIHPEDGTGPIVLPYAEGAEGASCDHFELVSSLRAAVASEPGVRFLPNARVAALDGEQVVVRDSSLRRSSYTVERVVGADGRSSCVRRLAGISNGRAVISHMAGIVLHGADLPLEGFGHLLVGGPGPIFVYRIGPDRLRACFDVPHPLPGPRYARRHLWSAYSRAFPEELVPAFSRALLDQPIQWAANQFRTRRRRSHYGQDRAFLVGDAVGHYHPLTAVGLALGFADAECLAKTTGLDAYRRERSSGSRVPELLALLHYEAFTRRDEGSVALRQAMYELWRHDSFERERTMRLLSSDEARMGPFCRSFLSVLGVALEQVAGQAVLGRKLRTSARSIGGLGWWLRRLAGAAAFNSQAASRAPLGA